MNIEICANSFQSAINAQLGAADRIELCTNLEAGGTTPDAATIQLATQTLHQAINGKKTEVFVLIRPRAGNFCYNPLELGLMRRNILFCKGCNVDGIVVGVLDKDGKVDLEACVNLVRIAYPMKLTFHRAFDRIENKSEALEQIIDLGFERILSSGGATTAWEGKNVIAQLIEIANGRISIMPGAGVNSENVKAIIDFTGAEEIHLSAKKVVAPSGKSTALFETPYWVTDVEEVRRVVAAVGK